MTTIFWILLTVSLLMYFEGIIIASFAGAMSQTPKIMWPFLLILWPLALPVLAYKTYVKYQPMIQQIQENPLLGSLLGLRAPQENPFAELFSSSQSISNPFVEMTNDIFTEVNPSGNLAEEPATEETSERGE